MPQSLDNLSVTWTGTTVYTGIKFSALDSGSGASLMMDLRAGAAGTTSVFSVAKDGSTFLGANGSQTLPSVGRGNTGLYFSALNGLMFFTVAGTYQGLIGSGEMSVRQGMVFGWESGGAASGIDIGLRREAAGVLAQRVSTTAQTFRVYNTFTSDTNFERGKIEWASNVLRIGTEKGSLGGTARALELQTDGTTRVTIAANGAVTVAGDFTANSVSGGAGVAVNSGGYFAFSSRGGVDSSADGVIRLRNNASSDFGRLQFGGTTSSFPAIKRSGTMLQARLADDSGFATLDGILSMEGTAPTVTGDTGTAGELRYDANYLYVCTAANTWKRVAIATW